MVKDHLYLARLLNTVKESVGKPELMRVFDDFKWDLEKHFFMEEKAIFIFWDSKDENDIMFDLMKEHEDILKRVKEVEQELKDGKEVDFFALQTMIIDHKDKEESEFYPKLDEDLTDEQKEIIRSRILEF